MLHVRKNRRRVKQGPETPETITAHQTAHRRLPKILSKSENLASQAFVKKITKFQILIDPDRISKVYI